MTFDEFQKQKREQAMKDIKSWLGVGKFNHISEMVQEMRDVEAFTRKEFLAIVHVYCIGPVEGNIWADELGIAPNQTPTPTHQNSVQRV